MAGASLLTVLDDITTVLDDVSVMTKAAAKQTAGVLGDDLALNAQQVAGVTANRELPVVWAVAKGSARNKLILVPAALAISALIPWTIVPLLMLGGAFLCYEGFEKIAHRLLHRSREDAGHHAEHVRALSDPAVDIVAYEREKVKGSVRTDFILCAVSGQGARPQPRRRARCGRRGGSGRVALCLSRRRPIRRLSPVRPSPP